MSAHAAPGRAISAWRKALYAGFAFGCFIALAEGLLGLAGVDPVSDSEDPFVGFASQYSLFEEAESKDGSLIFQTSVNKRSFFNHQTFARNKGDDAYRIFCLGGSTTFGRPYQHSTSFCGWLESLLPVADPSREWDVINAGGVSYASYRVAALMGELAAYEPDLYVIYTGHNEFLEERTYRELRQATAIGDWFRALAYETRLYAALRALLGRGGPSADSGASKPVLAAEVKARLDSSVGPDDYVRDEALEDQVALHFRSSLNRMVDLANDAGARVVFVTPASNLKDCTPFKSQHREGLSERDGERFDEWFGRGLDQQQSGDMAAALEAFDEALRIDDRFAELHYRRGKVLLALSRHAEAIDALRRALVEDICPLRALPRLRDSIRQVANQRGALLVDFEARIQREAREREGVAAPGEALFLDHVHPTIEAQRLLALDIVHALAQREVGVVRLDENWGDEAIAQVTFQVESGIDREAHARALVRLSKVLDWAGKGEEAKRVALQAQQAVPDDPQLRFKLARFAVKEGRPVEALRTYRELLADYPKVAEVHYEMGVLLANLEQPPRALAHALYSVYLRPDLDYSRELVGLLLKRTDRHREAVPHFREALRLNPQNAQAKRNLAASLAEIEGQPAAADEPARLHAARHPDGSLKLVAEIVRDAAGQWIRHGVETLWRGTQPSSVSFFDRGVLRERIPLASLESPSS